ncbi:GtrA family protein [Arthrobacter sp. Cr_A7]|uniref:GtrA family protein n=1 Tax=Arthrobacter sp. Cr_A7 TaxID=3031017 RepID=UPI0023DB620E|nr:GtrA family protein [Arthrobacter sp. Cr_A7]MDF2048697.1 GtrA family protein [Arthrobacter sp. Cr_A7]
MTTPSLQDTHFAPAASPVGFGRRSGKITVSPMVGRMSRFAAVGAFGTVLNLGIMSVMLGLGTHYLAAAFVATELTILSNFLMQERLVFHDMRERRPFWQRFAANFGFNNIETVVRMPVLVLLVHLLLIPGLVAQAVTLAAAFLVRFAFTSRVIYRVRPSASVPALVPATAITPVGVESA